MVKGIKTVYTSEVPEHAELVLMWVLPFLKFTKSHSTNS
jgi:hypothetical protein